MIKTKIIAYVIGGLIAISVPTYFIVAKPKLVVTPSPVSVVPTEPTSRCLADNEYADYPIDPKSTVLKLPIYPVVISVRDKVAGVQKLSFTINDVRTNYHPLEIEKCGVYTVRTFNYDESRAAAGKEDRDFQIELWKYSYDGLGEKKILLDEQVSKIYKDYFSPDFRVSANEKYISLIRGYLGVPEHALVIKSLETKEDVFTLSLTEIANRYPEAEAIIDFRDWTKGDKYFWGETFDGAYVLSLFRIEVGTWEYDIFKTPENMLGGDALNLETGWVTHNTINEWTGVVQLNEQLREEYRKSGKTGVFTLYNLFTKQEIVLEKATDPTYFFRPKWLSDVQLQYYLPSGETKIYTIK